MTSDALRQARDRATEAWGQRFKHVKAANNWTAIAAAETDPIKKKVYEILASWMEAYADADAEHERRFTELAAQ